MCCGKCQSVCLEVRRCRNRHDNQPSVPREVNPLTSEELTSVLEKLAEGTDLRDLHDVVFIVKNTGLRVGELAALRVSDVDFDRALISVVSKASARLVPFGPQTAAVLRARVHADPGCTFVFGDRPEKLLLRVRQQLRNAFTPLLKDPVTLQRLRHTFCTRFVAAGGHPAALAQILGVSVDRLGISHLGTKRQVSQTALLAEMARIQALVEGKES